MMSLPKRMQIDHHYSRMSPQEIQRAFVLSRHNELAAWKGMGFLDMEGENFQVIRKHVITAKQIRFNASLPELANRFREELKGGDFMLLTALCLSEKTQLRLYELPFLHLIDPDFFIDSYRRLDPTIMNSVDYSLKNRYVDEPLRKKMYEEYSWLVSLKVAAKAFIKASQSRFETYHINTLSEYILTNAITLYEQDQA